MDKDAEMAKVHSNEEGLRSEPEQQISRDDTIWGNVEKDTVPIKRSEAIRRQDDSMPSQEASSTLSMGAGKAYPQDLLNIDSYIVEFDGPSDPTHPQNWSMKRKLVRQQKEHL